MEEVTHPGDTVIIGDSRDIITGYSECDPLSEVTLYQCRYIYPGNIFPIDYYLLAARHPVEDGGGNYLFLDGHVMPISREYANENPELFEKK